jgi:hypothetical protein
MKFCPLEGYQESGLTFLRDRKPREHQSLQLAGISSVQPKFIANRIILCEFGKGLDEE